jgi:hypothetical protein
MPITVSGTQITFNDATVQTTAAVAGGVTSLNGQTGAITNTDMDAIGSYIAAVVAESATYNQLVTRSNTGDTRAGSTLRRNYTQATVAAFPNTESASQAGTVTIAYNRGGTALSGTYRCMGRSAGSFSGFSEDSQQTTAGWIPSMWVRIS